MTFLVLERPRRRSVGEYLSGLGVVREFYFSFVVPGVVLASSGAEGLI
jgi:hypothetical protein